MEKLYGFYTEEYDNGFGVETLMTVMVKRNSQTLVLITGTHLSPCRTGSEKALV